jgi:hypothetical protein
MLISKTKRAFALGFLAAGFIQLSCLDAAVLSGVNPTIIDVGTGSDISYLLIDESTLYSTPLEFIYHYTNDINNPLTEFDFLSAVTNASTSGLGITAPYNTNFLAHTFDAFTYGGKTVAGTPFNATNVAGVFWTLFDAGGVEVGGSPATNYPSTSSWNLAPVGIDGRYISPGSVDGWTIGSYSYPSGVYTEVDTPPSVAVSAVPEPATLPLILLSLAALIGISRWKSSIRISKA